MQETCARCSRRRSTVHMRLMMGQWFCTASSSCKKAKKEQK